MHAWAKGASWNDVIANTSLDEGDVVRILRRTVDLLAQVPYCEVVSEQLRRNARLALQGDQPLPGLRDRGSAGRRAGGVAGAGGLARSGAGAVILPSTIAAVLPLGLAAAGSGDTAQGLRSPS